MQNLVMLSLVLNTVLKTTGVRWRAVRNAAFLKKAFGRHLTQVSFRFGTSTLGLHGCIKFTAVVQLELQVLFAWPDSSGSPRSCVNGAVTVRSRHTWISPILFFVSSMSDSTARQHFWVLCPFPASDRCSRPASPCECPLQPALVPMSATSSSLHLLRVGCVPFPNASRHQMASHGSIGISWSPCGLLRNVLPLWSWLTNRSSLRLREFPSARASMYSS